MPNLTAVIGGTATAYRPDDTTLIALGYTHLRFYWRASETGAPTLMTSVALVAGQKDYSYNNTAALATDWFFTAPYGAVPGEGPASESMPIGPPQSTRLDIRQAVGRMLRLLDVHVLSSVTSATVGVFNTLIDPDASPHSYANRFARCSAGTAIGQTRRLRSGSTGYAVATGTVTLARATSPAWVANDSIEFWKAKDGEDPSAIIDECMQLARRKLWWQDTFYFTADSDVTDYAMPAIMREEMLTAVEWAADTYPSRPHWCPVPYWDFTLDGGGPVLSVASSVTGRSTFTQGTVFRVIWNRYGDRMDSDTDYWEVPLEWATAEVALRTLLRLGTPSGGQEDVQQEKIAVLALQEDLQTLRRTLMPRAVPMEKMPR